MDRRACLYCKVITRECVAAQHKLVVADYIRVARQRCQNHNKVVEAEKGSATDL
jgi:hypothetical protein